MAEAKHTTHRWQATASGSAWQVRDATGRRVCSVSTIRVEQEEEARLISAAPELLKALKGAIGALEFSREYHSDTPNADQAFAQDRLDAAVAAIAKAEGRSC